MATGKSNETHEDEEMNKTSSDESDSESDSNNELKHELIQVSFDGRSPTDPDFHGIRQLLKQLFLKTHINLSEMADIIISQNYIGSVAIQSELDEDEDDESDITDICDPNVVFGITTIINITNKKDKKCIQELKSYLINKAEKNASNDTKKLIKKLLNNDNHSVGFLINERFINIPAKLSIPLFQSLCKEIKRANEKKMDYNFSRIIMILKFYRKKGKKGKPSEDIFFNEEEEIINQFAESSFEFSAKSDIDPDAEACSVNLFDGNTKFTPYRKVVVLQGNKLPQIVSSIKEFIEE